MCIKFASQKKKPLQFHSRAFVLLVDCNKVANTFLMRIDEWVWRENYACTLIFKPSALITLEMVSKRG